VPRGTSGQRISLQGGIQRAAARVARRSTVLGWRSRTSAVRRVRRSGRIRIRPAGASVVRWGHPWPSGGASCPGCIC